MTHKVLLLPGDGIGPEIVDEALRVLKAAQKRFVIIHQKEGPILAEIKRIFLNHIMLRWLNVVPGLYPDMWRWTSLVKLLLMFHKAGDLVGQLLWRDIAAEEIDETFARHHQIAKGRMVHEVVFAFILMRLVIGAVGIACRFDLCGRSGQPDHRSRRLNSRQRG